MESVFEFVNASAGFRRDGQTVIWNVPKLASEESYSVWIVVRVLTNGTFENIAHVNCSEEGTVKNSTSTVNVAPVVNLTVVKTANSSEVKLGDEIIFTINVTNHGPSTATNVVVEDVLPDGFELISGDTKVVIDSLKSGESKVITITVKAINTGNITNVVYVSANESAHTGENTTDVVSNVTVLVTNPQMSVNKTANDKYVYAGNKTSFTITITNTGDTVLDNITLEEYIPEGLIYDSFIGSNWTNEGTKFLYNGSLGVGDSIELIIVVNTTKSGNFETVSTVNSDKVYRVVADADVIVYTPKLTVREISNNPLVIVGQPVSFTVVVTNIGDCELTGVYTVNNFPDGLIYTGYEGADWNKLTRGSLGVDTTSGWTQDGNKFTYSGTLQPGESANYTLFFDTTVVGVFTPEVIADSIESNNAYSNNTTVVIGPDMTVTKVANATAVKVGDLISYTITVKNTGNCDLGGIFVIEKAPKGLKFVSFKGDGWTKVGDKFVYAGSLAPQKSASFTVVFAATIAGNVTNVVIAGSNMTSNVTNSSDIEIVNKTKPTPHPTPKPTPKPVPEPVPKETVEHFVDKHETGNPIILLLLVILAIIPIRIRKK